MIYRQDYDNVKLMTGKWLREIIQEYDGVECHYYNNKYFLKYDNGAYVELTLKSETEESIRWGIKGRLKA